LIIKPFQAHPHNHQVSPKKQIIPPFLKSENTSHLHITWPIFQDNHQFVQVVHSQLTLSQTCQYFSDAKNVFSFNMRSRNTQDLPSKECNIRKMFIMIFSSLQKPSIFIFNIFFFIQNNTRRWTIMKSFPCYWKIWLMTCSGCICVKIAIGFSFFITWTCIVPCVIYCFFGAME